jgi:phenylacetate-CoA ligase
VREGARGEVALSCARNPFLPLLRYRTGDRALLVRRRGEQLLGDLEGRAPVVFLDAAGRWVNGIDVSYLLKPFPLARYALHQATDRSLRLSVQGIALDLNRIRAVLAKLFGDLPLQIGPLGPSAAGSGKLVPYTTDLPEAWRETEPGFRAFTFREIMHPEDT